MDKQVKTLHPSFEPMRVYFKAVWDQMCAALKENWKQQRIQREREANQNSTKRRRNRVLHAPQVPKAKPSVALAKLMWNYKEG